jgi:hypothetical protein
MEEGAGLAAAVAQLSRSGSCAPLQPGAAIAASLADEVRALVVEAARAGCAVRGWQEGGGGGPEDSGVSAAQRLRLVFNAAAELSALTVRRCWETTTPVRLTCDQPAVAAPLGSRLTGASKLPPPSPQAVLSALEAAAALHPGCIPHLVTAFHDGPRSALPRALAALAAGATGAPSPPGDARPAGILAEQGLPWSGRPQVSLLEHGHGQRQGVDQQLMPPPQQRGQRLVRVRGFRGGEAGGDEGDAAAEAFFSPRDPRLDHTTATAVTPPARGTPPAGVYGGSGERGSGGGSGSCGADLSQLTPADVLLLAQLKGAHSGGGDIRIAAALCAAVQGTR